MNKTLVTLGIFLGLMGATILRADVIVTEPIGGNDVSTDKAVNSTNGAGFVALGNIVLTEGAASDFGPGNGQTLILTAPDGWRLNTAAGASASFLNSRDITAAGVALTTSNITVTFSVGGTTKLDQLTISGVQVQPLNGATDPNAGYIVNLSANPGTASIAGIQPDLTTFGLLNTDPGKPVALGISTQPSSVAMAGVPFSVQPVVMTYDQFGNQCFLDVNTVVNATRAGGIGTLQGTTNFTVLGGECSFTNLSHNVANTITILFTASNLTSVTSQPIVVGPAIASRLVFTSQPAGATSGTQFAVQPALKSQDQFGNDSSAGLPAHQNVTMTLSSGTGPLLGNTNQDIGTNGGNGVVTYTNLEIDAAGNAKQLTASSSGFADAASSLFNVSGNGFSSLLVLAPGESLAPGTVTGKAGTPMSQMAGAMFNVTIYAVDANWNLINTATDVVSIACSDSSATLGADAPLVGGSVTFHVTLNTIGSATVTATDATDSTKSPGTSSAIQVTRQPARLTIQTQPSATATAGAAFSPQPVIRVEDASGNLITSDSGRVITATRGTGTAILQGTVTASTVNGVAAFTNLSYNVAETITLTFSTAGLTNATSTSVTISPAAADRLIFSTQPGGVSRVGSVLATQPVIKSRDAFGNLSTVGLPGNLPLSLTLSSGSGSLAGTTAFDIGTAAANGIVVCTNVQCTTAGTNKQLSATASGLTGGLSTTFSVGGVDPVLGAAAISADTVGGSYTALTGPVYYEAASGDTATGTIILNVPGGFIFDTNTPAPSVVIKRLSGSGANTANINGVASGTSVAVTSRSTNQITFTVTTASSAGVTCSMTWTNVRVRPLAGTPLASGNLTKTGTAAMAAVTASITSFGTLTEVAGLASRLAFTTQPGAANAGAPFGVQPVVRSRDQFGNNSVNGLSASKVVTLALTSGTGPLQGTTNLDIGTGVGNGVAAFSNLRIDSSGTNKQLTASATGFTNAASSVFTVAAAAPSRLTIATQPSSTATAGAAFAQQPVLRIEDGFGNLMSSDNTTVVTVSRGLGSGTLLGNLSRTASNGTVSFTNLSYNVAETISLNFSGGSLTGTASSNVVVSPAAAYRLTIQTQLPTSATAGAVFAPQPVIRLEDQFGNLRSSDNSTVVTAARGSGTGTLQGTTTATASGGVASFSNLSYPLAQTMTIVFSSGSLSNAISSNVLVGAGPFAKLQLLAPGETAAAGTASGKTGTPVAQLASTAFNVTVNAVDANWNALTNVSDTVGTTSSTTNATLPASSPLVNGTRSLMISFNTNGSFTLTASDVSDVGKIASTSPAITVNAAQFTPATGGSAISADGASGTFTSLTGPTYSENTNGNVGTGTIILKAPSGFIFDTGGTAPTVLITRLSGSGSAANNINGVASGTSVAMTSVTTTQLVFTVTSKSASGFTCKLTWQNVRVRPTAGTLPPGGTSGNLSSSGTASVVGLSASANLGTLREIAGAANSLIIQTQPSPTATAGVVFAQQPVIQVRDQFGNLRSAANGSSDNSTVVTASRNAGSGTLQGAASQTPVDGVVTFTNLSHNVATNITLLFSSGSLTSATSTVIAISPAAASALAFTSQPGNATAGSVFGAQPVVRSQDAFGNNSSAGLPASLNVTLSLSSGAGPMQGAASLDIGTGAGNGTASFTDLRIDAAGTNKQLTASASGLGNVASSFFTVDAGPASRLTVQTQPPGAATAGAAFAPQPQIRIEDVFGNLRTSDNNTVVNAVRNLGSATLQGTTTATASGGVATFANLSYTKVETMNISFSSGSLIGANSSNVVVSPAAASKLTIVTQPSSTATAGVVFAQQPTLRIEDPYGNLRSGDNSTVVTATRSAGSGTLQGSTNAAAINGIVTFANLSHNVATNITIAFTSGSLTSAISSTIAVSPAAASRLTIQAQPSTSATAGVAFPQQPLVRVEDAFGNLISSDNSTVVTASRASGAGTLQGTVTASALNGLATFTNLYHTVATNITIQFTGGVLASTVSSNITVSPAAAAQMIIQTQPPAAATAGATFTPPPQIWIEDAFGNLRISDNSTVVSAARNLGSGSLQGSAAATASGGVASFTNLSYAVAETMNLNFTSGSLTVVTSSNVVVSPAAASKLTIQTQPSATATAGIAFVQQPVVRIEDQYGNLRSGDNSTVVTGARAAGSGTLQGTLTATASNGVASFVNLAHNVATNITIQFSSASLAGATSGTIAVSPAAASRLSMQTPPPGTATAGAVFAPQPALRIEDAFGNLMSADNSSVVTATRSAGTGSLQGTTSATASGGVASFANLSYNVAETVTISFASGNLTGVTSANVVVGPAAASRLSLQTQPAATATAGVVFAPQPVVRIEDAYGNLRSSDSTTVVTASRNAGSGTLQGTTNLTAVNGVVTFTNLSHNVATNITINFSSGSLAGVTSGGIAISPALANRLVFAVQPGLATAGTPFGMQPAIKTQDQFGNDSTVALPGSAAVTLTLSSGTGPFNGTTTLDLGTNAGNGLAVFTALEIDSAGTNKQLTASASGMTNALSSIFTVNSAPAARLSIQTQPSATATAGAAFGQQPAVRIEDQFGNLMSSDNSTVVTVSRGLGSSVLQGTVSRAAVNGLVTFTNLSYNVAENINLSFSSGSLTGTASSNVVVSAAVASRLTIQTQPPSNATAGVIFAPQPVVRIEDQFGNLRSSDNSTVITATRSAGAGVLQGSTNVMAINGMVTFTNLSHTVATNITIAFSSGSLAGATSSVVVVSPAAASRLTVKTQPSASATAGVVFAQQPVLRIEDSFGNLVTNDSSTVVTAARNLGSGALQGTNTMSASGGLVSFTNLSYAVAETMNLSFSSGSLTPVVSSNVVVSAAAASRLTILTQPSTTATAGVVFAQQPAVRIEDQFGNLRTSDSSTVITAARAAGSGTLQGTLTATVASGVATFANLSHSVATNITIQFTSGTLTGVTSGVIAVSPAAASRLTIATQPSATATAGVVFAQQPVIRIEDQFGNLRSGDNSTVVTAARAAGSGTLQGTTSLAAANGVVVFANLSHNVATNITITFTGSGLASATSSTIAVSTATADHLTVQTQPSAGATAGVVFAQQPKVRIEDAFGNLISSDNSSVVTAARNAGSGTLQGTLTATAASGVASFTNLSHQVANTITVGFSSGTLAGAVSSNILVNPASATRLGFTTQPGAAVAGSVFGIQPVVNSQDQFGNNSTVGLSSSRMVTLSLTSGTGPLQGTTSLDIGTNAAKGVAAFTNLRIDATGTKQLTASSTNFTNAVSSSFVVSTAPASRLTIQTQPSSTATAGLAFVQQPVVRIEDTLGNLISSDNSTVVTATRSSGAGVLQGTVAVIAVNGIATFTNLFHAVATNITIQFAGGTLTSATSSNITVNPAAASRLTIATQPPSAATAGVALSPAPQVRIEDAFGNLRTSDNGTVVTAARSLGSGSLQGAITAATSAGVASFTNLSYTVAETMNVSFTSGSLASATSSNVVVSPAAASKLTIATQPSSTATAGIAFAQQPLVRIEDQYGNLRSTDSTTLVTASRSTGSGTLQGTTNLVANNGVVTFTNLSHNVATNITIAFASGSLSGNTSTVVAVSPAVASRLTIRTQPSATATAGVGFAQQPVVRIEDGFGNLIVSDSSTAVTATRNLGTGALQGAATATASGGVAAFTNLSYSVAETINITFGSGSLIAATSSNIVVSPAAASQLTILTQPSSTATAGVVFGQQPVVRIEDQFGNLRSSDNSTLITASRAAGSGTLQGTVTATATSGVATFTNLSHNVATNITIQFTGGALTSVTSAGIAISPAAANRLTIAIQPSSAAAAGVIFGQQPVVRIEDQFGNLRSGDNGMLVTATRAAGSGTLQGTTSVPAVNGMVSFSDLSHNVATNITVAFTSSGLTAATSITIAVSATSADHLTILNQPSSSATAGVIFAQQPKVRIEDSFGNLMSGDNTTVVTALRAAGSAALQGATSQTALNGLVTFTNLSYNLAETISLGFGADSLKGTASSNVVVSAGLANRLTLQTPPSSTATAGVAFAQQPVIRVEDQFGNLRSSDNATVVSASRSSGTGNGTLQGTTNVTSVNGLVTFTNLSHNVATNITLNFTSGALASATSDPIVISPAAVNRLVFATQPASATAGAPFGVQPAVKTQDAFGNDSTVALASNLSLTISLSSGAGALQGTTTLDIGVNAGNGAVSFNGLELDTAGTNKQLSASATGLSNALSSMFNVNPAAADHLAIQSQPASAATAGGTFSPQPQIRIEDAFGNLRTSDNSTVVTATSHPGGSSGSLQGIVTAMAVNGVATFTNLSYNIAETITIDFAGGGLPGVTSTTIAVTPAAASRLTIQSQPSSAAMAGALFAQQPMIRIEDQFGNLRNSDNSTVVSASRSSGTGSGNLQGTTNLTAVGGIVAFTNLSHIVATNIMLAFASSGLSGATSTSIAVSPAAASKLNIQQQPSATGTAGAAFAQQPKIRIEDQFGNLRSSDNGTIVTASRNAGSGALQGTTSLNAINGVVGFTNLAHNVATTITIDFNSAGLTGVTSANVVVSPAGFARLQLLAPGETAAPGTVSGKIGGAAAQTAGAGYSVTVNAVDTNWNLVTTVADTVGITCTDPNDVLPANMALVSGSKDFSLTNRTSGSWTITATDITDGTKTASTSPAITVNSGPFTKLQLLVPGETASPGSSVGKTGTPAAQTAGTAFTVTVNAVDANWNLVNTVADIVAITSSDTNAVTGSTLQLFNGSTASTVTLTTAGSRTLTATDLSDGSKAANTSPSFTVNVGAFVKLQLLSPGEAAAPGTASGKTGAALAQNAGTAFNVTVNAVDANWNVVTNVTHTIGITSSDANAVLPANAALVSGTKGFGVTLKTIGTQTLTASDLTNPAIQQSSNPAIQVNPAPANKLTIQTQPPSTVTAGVVFAPQPVVRVEDAAGNLIATDNGRVITAARGTGTGALQGTPTATTVNGVATFTNLSYNVAETITINFTATGLTNAASGNVVVSPATAVRLVMSTQPGGLSRTASPLATQPVVKSQDPFGNTSSIGLPASLNVSLSLTAGSGSLLGTTTLNIGASAGNGTATFTNVECSDAGTNKQITASAAGLSNAITPTFLVGGVDRAIGGAAIPSSSAGGAYTALTGPTYYEVVSGDAGTGTIILNAPSGFIFDTGGTAPTVLVTRIGGTGANSLNIDGVASGTAEAISTISITQIKFSEKTASSAGVTCALTWQNVRVRPTASSPLASGNITDSGSAVLAAVTSGSTSLGRLTEVGPAARLTIQTQPSSTATAGVTFQTQPVIRIEDAFGNLISTDNSTVVTAARSAGSGTLQGTLTATATGGLATFTNLFHNVATNITIGFTSGSLTSTSSTSIAVGPASAEQMVFITQPANGTVGVPLATQPVVCTLDRFGNVSAVGLGGTKSVGVALSSGTGPLLGTATLDIGTNAGNGLINFTDLRIDSAGTNKQLTASASGLSNALSSAFVVVKSDQTISFGALPNKSYGAAPFALSATASSGLAVSFSIVSGPATLSGSTLTITAAGTVTVRASQSGDATWNPALPVDQSFGVAPALLTVRADDKTRTYGAADPPLTASFSGFVNGDSASVLSGSPGLSASATPGSPVAGSPYPIAVTQGTLSAANYSFNFVNGSLAVTKATLTVTAENKSRVYGASNPTLTASYSGFVNGDTTAALGGSPSLSTTATPGSPVTGSPYPITVSQGTLSAANYSFKFTGGSLTITKATLTVTAEDKSCLYGANNPPLTASYSGFVNGETTDVLSGSPSLSTTATPGSPVAGNPYPITVTQGSLSTSNYSFSFIGGSLTVTKATLTVTAENKSRVYGATNPPLTASYSGFVNGDTMVALGGSPSLSTAADTSSAVAGSPYSITAAQGTLNAANYDFVFADGTLAITPASVLSSVTSSANPSPTGSNLTFAATLSAVAPGGGMPSGTVQFKCDGLPLGSPASLANGVASLTTSALAHGTHTITAEYAGDGNFFGTTNGLGASQVINIPPVALPATYTRSPDTTLQIAIANLLTNYTSDADGDARALVSVGTSTNGAMVAIVGNWIFYAPSDTDPNRNTPDHFDYTITDGFSGGTVTNQICVSLSGPDPASQPPMLSGIRMVTNNIILTFTGIAGYTYHIERAPSVTIDGSGWIDIASVATDSAGNAQFTDTSPIPGRGFYRVVWKK